MFYAIERVKAALLRNREIEGECWLYTKYIKKNGYGWMQFRNGAYSSSSDFVHRISYAVFRNNGEMVKQVNHVKECPNKHCFNPDHLYNGTQKENIRDAIEKAKVKGFVWNRKRTDVL